MKTTLKKCTKTYNDVRKQKKNPKTDINLQKLMITDKKNHKKIYDMLYTVHIVYMYAFFCQV